MNKQITEPGEFFNGEHHHIWKYSSVPEGMRRARLTDLRPGRVVLYEVRTGPDEGMYYTGFVQGANREVFRWRILNDIPVYVKD